MWCMCLAQHELESVLTVIIIIIISIININDDSCGAVLWAC